jgi:hypothetical protein
MSKRARTTSSTSQAAFPVQMLSRDVLDLICRFLDDWRDLVAMTSVCRAWRAAGANLRAFVALLKLGQGDHVAPSARERFIMQLSSSREQVRQPCVPTTYTLNGTQCAVRCVSLTPDGTHFFAGEFKVVLA